MKKLPRRTLSYSLSHSFSHSLSLSWLIFSLLFVSIHAQANTEIIGKAFDIEGGDLLYTEYHQKIGKDQWLIIYKNKAGEKIAEKTLDYSLSLARPSYALKNYWSKKQSIVYSKENEQEKLYLQFGDVDKPENQLKEKSIDSNQVVVDAGFDHFIRKNWAGLLSGEPLEYRFAVPSRFTSLAMQAKQIPCEEKMLQALDYQQAYLCFQSQVKNVLLRFVVPPFELVYDVEEKRLHRFIGLGNIADDKRKTLEVDIRYSYVN